MSRSTSLTSQTRKVCLVIRKNVKIPLSKIKEYCDAEFERYAFIEHEHTFDPSSGEEVPVHYHIVGDFFGSKVALSTRLNTLVNFFKFKNRDGVQIEQYRTFEGALQYLTHKNQPDKTPVSKDKIITNLSPEDFEIFYNADVGSVITFDLLYSTCLSASNIIEVIRAVGIGNYKQWRNVIWDIWNVLNDKPDYKRNDN